MKITRPIRAVLFDMDGVMVDSEFVYMKYLLEFAREKNPAVTMEDINPMVGRSRQDSWMVMERAVDNGESWETLIKEWDVPSLSSPTDFLRYATVRRSWFWITGILLSVEIMRR